MPKPEHDPIPCPDCEHGWVSGSGGVSKDPPTPEMLQHVIVSRPRMHGKARFLREGEAWDAVINAAFGTEDQPLPAEEDTMTDRQERRTSSRMAALLKFEKALCVQYDGEVLPGDWYRAYRVWHNDVRPAFGLTCPVVVFGGEHGDRCPLPPSKSATEQPLPAEEDES